MKKKNFNFGKQKTFFLLLMILAIPLFMLVVFQGTGFFPLATTVNNYELTNNYDLKDSPDWETKENYRYSLIPELKTYAERNLLGLKLSLYYEGSELSNFPNLYLKSVNKGGNLIVLKRDKNNRNSYFSEEFLISQGGDCFNIFSTKNPIKEYYKGSFCFKSYIVSPGRVNIYSPSAKMQLSFDYQGNGALGVLTIGTVFDATDYFNNQFYANKLGEKVVYFIYDNHLPNVRFFNLEYLITPMLSSEIPQELKESLCGNSPNSSFSPRLHQTLNRALPAGGYFENYSERVGYCSFKYRSSNFISGFLSHSPLVRKIGQENVYHTECRMTRKGFFLASQCVRVPGPGEDLCRTDRDCLVRPEER